MMNRLQTLVSISTGAATPWELEPGRRALRGRGLHSSIFHLNLSASQAIGGARGGYVARVKLVSGGVLGVLLCQARLKLSEKWTSVRPCSEASSSDQRGYVDRIFAGYGTLMLKAESGDTEGLRQGLTLVHFSAQLKDLRDTSLALELNLSTFGTHPRVRLGSTGDKVS